MVIKMKYNIFFSSVEFVDFFFVDTTPFEDSYFTNPGDDTYDWSGVLPREVYLSNLLKVTWNSGIL